MIDLKVNKVFKDSDTGEDIYVISINLNGRYYNLNVNRKEYRKIWKKMKSIEENNDL